MGILKFERKVLQKLIDNSFSLGQLYGEKKKIHNKWRRELINRIELSDNQKKEIDNYYKKHYGKRIGYDWHRYFMAYSGVYKKEYFPEELFSSKFELIFNPFDYSRVLDDKLLLEVFINGINNVKTPQRIAYSYGDIICNSKNEIISFEELITLLQKFNSFIIKPSCDTNSGIGVQLIKKNSYERVSDLEKMIKHYSYPYIIQEHIKQHPKIAIFNQSSTNSFRVITYILNGKVNVAPITFKIGRNGSIVDNQHAGGLYVDVSNDGFLGKYAYDEKGKRFSKHPDSHVVFEKYKIPFINEIIISAKKMHLNTPQLGIISWDLTVNDKNNIILIEANTQSQSVDFSQLLGHPVFDNNTSEILEIISKKKKYTHRYK